MRRLLRFISLLLGVLGVLVLLAVVGVGGLLWTTKPPRNATVPIAGLSAPVQISYGAHGIPYIRAANLTDAAAALGYAHARDRMFQMELMRRAASGTLSEIAGPATLNMDKEMRVLGLRRSAQADYANLPPDAKRMLEAYAPA